MPWGEFLEAGKSRFWAGKSRFLEAGTPRILESKKTELWNKKQQMEILKIQIHVAQNVGKVWIGQKRNFWAPSGATPGYFLHGPTTIRNYKTKYDILDLFRSVFDITSKTQLNTQRNKELRQARCLQLGQNVCWFH